MKKLKKNPAILEDEKTPTGHLVTDEDVTPPLGTKLLEQPADERPEAERTTLGGFLPIVANEAIPPGVAALVSEDQPVVIIRSADPEAVELMRAAAADSQSIVIPGGMELETPHGEVRRAHDPLTCETCKAQIAAFGAVLK